MIQNEIEKPDCYCFDYFKVPKALESTRVKQSDLKKNVMLHKIEPKIKLFFFCNNEQSKLKISKMNLRSNLPYN